MTILQEALDTVEERQEVYGHPIIMAERVSSMFFEMTGIDLSPGQCIQFMMAMKLARLVETPDHRDSWLDLAGYVEVLDRLDDADTEFPPADFGESLAAAKEKLEELREGIAAAFNVPEEILGEDFGSWEAPAGHGPVGMKYGEPTSQSRHAEVLTGDPTYRKPGTRD